MLKRWSFYLVRKYRHSTISQWLVLIMDVVLFLMAFALMESFRANGLSEVFTRGTLIKFIWSFMLTTIFFFITGSYRGIIRHAGMTDIYKIMSAAIAPLILCWIVNIINYQFTPPIVSTAYMLSYRESLTLYLILGILMILSRMFMQRVYNEFFRRRRPSVNVVIYGAGAAGMISYNALKQESNYEYHVLAFIDDDMSKVNQQLNGVPVMRARSVLNTKFIESKNVKQLIIAIPTIRTLHKQAITNKALDLGMTVKAVPHVSTWLNGSFSANQIQDIKIEDLLEREPIKMDNVNIVREVVDKVVLVTGAAGSIGSEICRQLMTYQPKKVIMLDQAESPMYDLQFELKNTYKDHLDRMAFVIANVKDKARMEEVFELYHPQLVYHAAAYKHVPFMEENPYEAVFINVFGTRNLADLAIKYGVQKFVMISTDKAVNPTNVMGATKRMCEMMVMEAASRHTDTKFCATRFGNVLASNGSVVPLFKKQIAAGGPLTVTDKRIIRYFMTIPEATQLVLTCGALSENGELFALDMGKPMSILSMAENMIRLSGLEPYRDIDIVEIGLRPGEKLYEELLIDFDKLQRTQNDMIFVEHDAPLTADEITAKLATLHAACDTLDDKAVYHALQTTVPTFHPAEEVNQEALKSREFQMASES